MPRISLRSKSDPEKKKFARMLRRNQTNEESILWGKLMAKRAGFKFTRQSVIRGYIVDFYCPEAKVAIEIDGPSHDKRKEYDAHRDGVLSDVHVLTIRFTNEDVRCNLDSVLSSIISTCVERAGKTVTSFKRW